MVTQITVGTFLFDYARPGFYRQCMILPHLSRSRDNNKDSLAASTSFEVPFGAPLEQGGLSKLVQLELQ